MRRNLPAGWEAFRQLRREPLSEPEPWHHGNWRHGERSQEGRETLRQLKIASWILRHGGWPGPSPFPPAPRGWAEYVRHKRENRAVPSG
jgi:hypothetical protein